MPQVCREKSTGLHPVKCIRDIGHTGKHTDGKQEWALTANVKREKLERAVIAAANALEEEGRDYEGSNAWWRLYHVLCKEVRALEQVEGGE